MGLIHHLSSLAILYGHIALLCSAQSLIADLKAKGIEFVAPGDAGYENASLAFNHRFTFTPAAVTYPKTPAQVSTIVQTAAKYNTHVSARSGGHSYIANALGGQNGSVVVDVNRYFTDIEVDSSSNRAIIQTGNRLGNIALALNAKGQGIGHGTCPYVGIGGHSSFGGYGFTSRQWGLALDSIVSIDLVLANGTITTASKSQNSDLFWGMRGAGPSFGITTSITVQTYPVPPAATSFIYTWDLSAAQATSALNLFQEFSLSQQLPQQFGSELVFGRGSQKGRVSFAIQGAWYGDATKFNTTISPFMSKMTQKQSQSPQVQQGTYIDSVAFFGGLKGGRLNTTGIPDGRDNFYVKSLFTPQNQPMTSQAQQAFVNYLANQGFSTSLDWFVEVEQWGGAGSAINTVLPDDTSFATRDSLFLFQLYAFTDTLETTFPSSGFTLVDGMVNSIVNSMPSGWGYSAYPNYLDNRLQNWQNLYFRTHYPELQQLKASVDPKNMFNFPTSIELPS